MHTITDDPSGATPGLTDLALAATNVAVLPAIGLLVGIFAGIAIGRIRRGMRGSAERRRPDDLLELADTPDLGFVRFDAELTATEWNRGMGLVLDGIAASDRGAEERPDWWVAIHPEDHPRLRKTLRGLEPARSTSCDFRVHGSAGRWCSMRGTAHRRVDGTSVLLFHGSSPQTIADRSLESAARLRRTMEIATETLEVTDDVDETMCELLPLIGDELRLKGIGWYGMDTDARCHGIASWSPGRSSDTATMIPTTMSEELLARLESGKAAQKGDRFSDRLTSPIRINGHLDSVLVADFEPDEHRRDEVVLIFGRFCDALGRRFEREEAGRERESFMAIRGSLERCEILPRLTSGLRHDFNNVAFAIGGRISLLLQRAEDPVVIEGLGEIRKAVAAAGRLIERFAPSEGGDTRLIQLPLRAELEVITDTAKRLLPRRLDMEFECDRREIDDAAVIESDPEAFQRLLLNLVVNSRDAIRGRGRIRVSARRLDSDRVEIRVDDDGPGIPPQDRRRLLQPFESGPERTSVGYGLAFCHRSVERMGGRFDLIDSPLGGLGVRLVLPFADATPRRPSEPLEIMPDDARMPRATLVVEDNAVVREVITAHLEQAGTRVTHEGDATGVEDRLANDSEIEMLVMDIDLPGRSGIECISALRGEGDRTPCVLITGGVMDPPPLERTRLLRKPFGMEPLIATIRSLFADCDSRPDAGQRVG